MSPSTAQVSPLTHWPRENFNISNNRVLQQQARQAPAAQDAAEACLAGYYSRLARSGGASSTSGFKTRRAGHDGPNKHGSTHRYTVVITDVTSHFGAVSSVIHTYTQVHINKDLYKSLTPIMIINMHLSLVQNIKMYPGYINLPLLPPKSHRLPALWA